MRFPNPYLCKSCGHKVRPAAKVCRHCGRQLTAPERYAFRCDCCGRFMREAFLADDRKELCGVCRWGAPEPRSFAR